LQSSEQEEDTSVVKDSSVDVQNQSDVDTAIENTDTKIADKELNEPTTEETSTAKDNQITEERTSEVDNKATTGEVTTDKETEITENNSSNSGDFNNNSKSMETPVLVEEKAKTEDNSEIKDPPKEENISEGDDKPKAEEASNKEDQEESNTAETEGNKTTTIESTEEGDDKPKADEVPKNNETKANEEMASEDKDDKTTEEKSIDKKTITNEDKNELKTTEKSQESSNVLIDNKNDNILPESLRNMLPSVISYNSKTKEFRWGDKIITVDLNEGAGQIASLSPIILGNKYVRDKLFEFLKDEAKDKVEEAVAEKIVDQSTDNPEAKANLLILYDGLKNMKDVPKDGPIYGPVKFFAKTLKSGFYDHNIELGTKNGKVVDMVTEQDREKIKFVNDHPEIDIPKTKIGYYAQYDYVQERLMIKKIAAQLNVSEREAENIYHSTPSTPVLKTPEQIKKENQSQIKQN
jgi:hypothetical protein